MPRRDPPEQARNLRTTSQSESRPTWDGSLSSLSGLLVLCSGQPCGLWSLRKVLASAALITAEGFA